MINLSICTVQTKNLKLITSEVTKKTEHQQTQNGKLTSKPPKMSIPISEKVLQSYKLSKKFNSGSQNQISSLNFDDSGHFLLTTNFNQSIQLFDSLKGKHLKSIQSQKYGCHLAKFTHSTSQNCIYSSTKNNDHTIRYLSLVDNSYIRYFKGHTDFVNSMEVSPTHDLFISSSLDNTVRLWDLRASNQQALNALTYTPIATAFDPSGLAIGIADNHNNVYLKDIKMLNNESFLTFQLPPAFQYNKFEFSNDNKYILFSSTNGDHLVIDSWTGDTVMRLTGLNPPPHTEIPTSGTACFTPDGKYVLSGSESGDVLIYKLDSPTQLINGEKILFPSYSLKSEFDSRPRMIHFNPKFQEFITADVDVCMWIPDL